MTQDWRKLRLCRLAPSSSPGNIHCPGIRLVQGRCVVFGFERLTSKRREQGKGTKRVMIQGKLEKIRDWPEQARQARWSGGGLAKQCGVSGDTLRRYFLQHFGRTPKVWLAGQRQHEAIALLRDGSSIKESAAYLGYKQQTNFTRHFKEVWNCCPTQVAHGNTRPAKMRPND